MLFVVENIQLTFTHLLFAFPQGKCIPCILYIIKTSYSHFLKVLFSTRYQHEA